MRRLFVIIIVIILAGCSSYTFHTASGLPEVVIYAKQYQVREKIINDLASKGLMLIAENDHQLVFSKQLDGDASAMYQFIYSGAYSTIPEWILRFNFVKDASGGVRVIGTAHIKTINTYGQVTMNDATHGKGGKQLYDYLLEVKGELHNVK